jgi:hypothetical protein
VWPWRYAAIVCWLVPDWGGQVVLGGPYHAMSSALKVVVVGERVGNLMCHSRRLTCIVGADLPDVQGIAVHRRRQRGGELGGLLAVVAGDNLSDPVPCSAGNGGP